MIAGNSHRHEPVAKEKAVPAENPLARFRRLHSPTIGRNDVACCGIIYGTYGFEKTAKQQEVAAPKIQA
jgi:hypothetical protein